jgi:hypothetical protein
MKENNMSNPSRSMKNLHKQNKAVGQSLKSYARDNAKNPICAEWLANKARSPRPEVTNKYKLGDKGRPRRGRGGWKR